jgi:nucleoside-diphosphate-sugar epimerase
MNNSIVFITGINGFVGRNLKPYLSEYFDIKSISRKERLDGLAYKILLNS